MLYAVSSSNQLKTNGSGLNKITLLDQCKTTANKIEQLADAFIVIALAMQLPRD